MRRFGDRLQKPERKRKAVRTAQRLLTVFAVSAVLQAALSGGGSGARTGVRLFGDGSGLCAGITAFGAEKPEDMDEEDWSRLQDNVLEYDEISDLVKYYNPVYRQASGRLEQNTGLLKETAGQLHDAAEQASGQAELAADFGDVYTKMTMQALAQTERRTAASLNRAAENADTMSAGSLRYARLQLENAVCQMVIAYQRTLAAQEMADAAVELTQAAYESAQTQYSVGLASAADVDSAQTALTSARNQKESLENGLETLRQNIGLMTGWSYDASFEIGVLPAPDRARIDTMDPSVDIDRAVTASHQIEMEEETSGKGTVNRERKFRNIEELTNELTIQLDSLYQTVLECRTSADAADTALAAARLEWEGSTRRYRLGMIGRLEYLQAQMTYLQQESAARTATMDLFQAIEDYEWALKGVTGSGK